MFWAVQAERKTSPVVFGDKLRFFPQKIGCKVVISWLSFSYPPLSYELREKILDIVQALDDAYISHWYKVNT